MTPPNYGQWRSGSKDWREVSREAPCPICQKPDWCSVSRDGKWVACRREARGAAKAKTDKNGAEIYLHRIATHAALDGPPVGNGHATAPQGPSAKTRHEIRRADATLLDSAYTELLQYLTLSDRHREELKARGLTDQTIADCGYRSFPKAGRAVIARTLQEQLGNDFATIPGFVVGGSLPMLVGSEGLLIPCRDVEGRIIALKVRRDGAAHDGRYRYISSSKHEGPGPGAPVHISLGIAAPALTVRLTEGELKADIATALSGLPTISVPGVTNWRPGLDVLKALGAKTVRLAFDSDAETKRPVAKALHDCAIAIRVDGFDLEFERWDPALGKGIDDLLAAGGKTELLTGESAVAAIKELAKVAGAPVHAAAPTELGTQLQSVLDAGGPAALFADRKLLDKLARIAAEDAAQWAILCEHMRSAGVRTRELDRIIKPLIRKARIDRPSTMPIEETEVYFISETGCICRQKQTSDGPVSIPLANFAAKIIEQTVHDDGAETRTVFAIEGSLAGGRPLPRVEVSADEFPRMNWPVSAWGTQAVVYAGMSTKDHTRAAMQILSGEVPRRFVYGHTGWRQIDDRWYYLHGGGAIGPTGLDASVDVALPDALGGYCLPEPPAGTTLVEAIRVSLRLVELAPARITFPLLSVTYRAVLGDTDFGLHLAGPTGVFKTELAALGQQHFGVTLDARHCPGSWSSTGNSLEATAFAAKDAILVVDDFAPNGSTSDVQRTHREADRLLRAQGNHSGRQRMRADGSLRTAKPPRGLILSTGEDVPRGQSLRARMLILEIGPSDIDQQRLTACQRDARDGRYAQALAGFVRWLAPKYDSVHKGLRAEVAQLRDKMLGQSHHARTPSIVADLCVGLKYLLAFAVDVGAITPDEAEELKRRGWTSLLEAAEAQVGHQEASEPTRHFLRLLSGALASGRAHVASPTGDCPTDTPEAWGWRSYYAGDGSESQLSWRSEGRRIGWIDGDDLFLEPEASFAEIQRLANDQGESIGVTSRTLHKRLREKGHLRSTDSPRKTATIRRTLEGQRREVLHLHSSSITGEQLTNLTSQRKNPADPGESGQFDGQFPEIGTAELTSETDQNAENDGPMGSLVSSANGEETSSGLGFDSIPVGDGYVEGEL